MTKTKPRKKAAKALLLDVRKEMARPRMAQSTQKQIANPPRDNRVLGRKKLLTPRALAPETTDSVATILERESQSTIRAWLGLVEDNEELNFVPLNYHERTGHLPKLLEDLIFRLRLPEGTKRTMSAAAGHHGKLRHEQGYSVPMVVEESRILQISVFGTLLKNVSAVDFSKVLKDVVTIADEVDSQLKEQMVRFMESPAAIPGELARA
jgi:hypothetical protein